MAISANCRMRRRNALDTRSRICINRSSSVDVTLGRDRCATWGRELVLRSMAELILWALAVLLPVQERPALQQEAERAATLHAPIADQLPLLLRAGLLDLGTMLFFSHATTERSSETTSITNFETARTCGCTNS